MDQLKSFLYSLGQAVIIDILVKYAKIYFGKISFKEILLKLQHYIIAYFKPFRELKFQTKILPASFMKSFNEMAYLALTGALFVAIGIGGIILHLGIGVEKNIYLTTILAASIPMAVYIPRKMFLNDNF